MLLEVSDLAIDFMGSAGAQRIVVGEPSRLTRAKASASWANPAPARR